ncbi:MerR family transcriptional regulator [Enterocloster bolteae]|uniref:MerR family transcriptional regulator n=1 Tax=Enterocloster bolteae TaxID=208479 RepID=UPI002A81C959|nr:MerR family transcriptional regulator [Enterocloster bolteae]
MYYTIKQVSEMTGLTEHTLRFYTDRKLVPCKRDGANRRVFDDESLNWLEGVICLRKCGVSIEDISAYCNLCREGNGTLEERYRFMLKQRDYAYQQLKEARELVEYMERKVAHYEDVIAGKAADDTNPATQTISKCD